MTRKDRVKTALKHKQADIVPYNIELVGPELAKVADYLGIEEACFADYAGNHIEKTGYNVGGGFVRPNFFKDEFGVVWDRSGPDKDIGIIEQTLLNEPDLTSYKFPEPDIEQIKTKTAKFIGNGRNTFKFGKIGMTYFERAWSLRGMENLLMDFHLNPEFVNELFDNILQYNMKIIDAALQYDVDGFYFGDDYGQQNGLIMSPQTWRAFVRPGLKQMFAKVKEAGKAVALHSCGNISELFGDMIDIGLDIYQTVQPEIYDLSKLKTDYGNDLTFWGAISTQKTLPFVGPNELKDIVKQTINIMGVNGGYIAAPTHKVPQDVPVENIIALIEVLKEQ